MSQVTRLSDGNATMCPKAQGFFTSKMRLFFLSSPLFSLSPHLMLTDGDAFSQQLSTGVFPILMVTDPPSQTVGPQQFKNKFKT